MCLTNVSKEVSIIKNPEGKISVLFPCSFMTKKQHGRLLEFEQTLTNKGVSVQISAGICPLSGDDDL